MQKWWGWGNPKFSFPMENRPQLWPWISRTIGIEKETVAGPVGRERVRLSPARLDAGFLAALKGRLKASQLAADDEQRLLHSYGKSYPDLFYVRQGIVRRAPDLVVFPEGHEDVEHVVRQAHAHGVVLVAFGGGTNIVGGVNPAPTDRMVISLDMARMNRLISLDPHSQTAVIEAGALGPKLEADLQARGYSLGHYPDSFEYSTLGGWLATRSAGMQSDAYGKIEHMLVSLKAVTPAGTIVTRPVPASSAGPDINRMIVGSEGVLGVITEATMRVHPIPAVKDYRGVLFRSFEDGIGAIHDCIAANRLASMIRLQDESETDLAFHMKAPKTGLTGLVHRGFKKLLRARGYASPAIMIVGFEGDAALVRRTKRDVMALLKRRGGVDLGASVGKAWSEDKFNLPYLRDYVMDRGVMVDVAETSTSWTNILSLHGKVHEALRARFAADRGKGFIGCHLSHTYETGACLYFTYACPQAPGREMEQYYGYKRLITDVFMRNGATLSHHHAIGREHRPWMGEEVGETGLRALRALKTSLDPSGIMNPGKLLPDEKPGADAWAQPEAAVAAGSVKPPVETGSVAA